MSLSKINKHDKKRRKYDTSDYADAETIIEDMT